ncbi:sodium:proton antiporter NhaD [Salinimicrobium gaetbulicola]|uniref:Sodium:proton antiporter NhaD n=1 Tax=Salinimicrobium gaetbulicola TaxID=999702 RepID=A0ABW3II07_9FLAO
MIPIIIVTFFLGYLLITLEHPLKLDKAVSALLMATIMWAFLSYGFHQGWLSVMNTHGDIFNINGENPAIQQLGFKANLMHHFSSISEILFFLIGAMTIVEIVDLHRGFGILKKAITTTNKVKLLWILGLLAFVLSAIIDNLTATIILVTLLRKLVPKRDYRVWFAAMIVIAANAGGAWSPIGDVTTTMLWINNKVTTSGLSEHVILPAVICFVIPFVLGSRLKAFRGETVLKTKVLLDDETQRLLSSKKMLYTGLGAILFVPVFKVVTGLPPYVGMLFSLGFVWLVSEYVRPVKNLSTNDKYLYSTTKALSKIEFSSILFFLGILLAVAALESMVVGSIAGQQSGALLYAAHSLSLAIPNMDLIVVILGILSAVVDNVPLVAAAMGMYDFPVDNHIWHFIAYSAGTGGSLLVIGSAAGVAAMGMEKIKFMWYLKNIGPLAMIGFLSGAISFMLNVFFFQ